LTNGRRSANIGTCLVPSSFAAAWKGRKVARLGTLRIAVIGRAEFVRNKRASGRTKDMLDLQLLEELERN
jgi:hypothetical protein